MSAGQAATSQWVFSSSMAAGNGGNDNTRGDVRENCGNNSVSIVSSARPPMLRSETFHLMSGGGQAVSSRPESWPQKPQQVPELPRKNATTSSSSQTIHSGGHGSQQMLHQGSNQIIYPSGGDGGNHHFRNSYHGGVAVNSDIPPGGAWLEQRVLVDPRYHSNGQPHGNMASTTFTLPRSVSYHSSTGNAARYSADPRNSDTLRRQRRLSTFINRQDSRHNSGIAAVHPQPLPPVFYSPQYHREPWPRHIVDIPINTELVIRNVQTILTQSKKFLRNPTSHFALLKIFKKIVILHVTDNTL